MTQNTQVDMLEAKGLIRLASIRPELEYLFRHGLVQDAAYGSLLKQERRELHGRVGEALEELYPERPGELARVLAMHFEQAGETEKAIDYYAAGANHALGQYAIQEAFAAFDRAASLIAEEEATRAAVEVSTGELDRRRRRRIEIELGQGGGGLQLPDARGVLRRARAHRRARSSSSVTSSSSRRVHMLIALERLQNGEPATNPTVKRSLDRIARDRRIDRRPVPASRCRSH